MGFLSVLSFARKLVGERLRPGETAVDATVGNGVDTRFLAELTGRKGRVFGFDIQAAALEEARRRLGGSADPGAIGAVHLFQWPHERMLEVLPEETVGHTAAVMFNLGYLPGGDTRIVTVPETTVPALDASLTLLRKGGIVTAVLYRGHDGGGEEAATVERWAEALPQERFEALRYQFANRANHASRLLAVVKR